MNITCKNIKFIYEVTSKEEILNYFAVMAEENEVILCKKTFIEGLLERESEFSTGIGKGVAIPHCKSSTVKEPTVLIQKFSIPVQWESIDGQPVELAICLAIPEKESGTTHLKLLSKIARSLINEEITSRLLNSNNEENLLLEIKNIIND